MSELPTFEQRFEYLALGGQVGSSTFGYDRWINQRFYRSREWRRIRHAVILRDQGCDLGIDGYEINDSPVIHHMNPMGVDEIVHGDEDILDPEFLITTTHQTHNAIHYGDVSLLPRQHVDRRAGDTQLWSRRFS
jgi:hypothetical protein